MVLVSSLVQMWRQKTEPIKVVKRMSKINHKLCRVATVASSSLLVHYLGTLFKAHANTGLKKVDNTRTCARYSNGHVQNSIYSLLAYQAAHRERLHVHVFSEYPLRCVAKKNWIYVYNIIV